uniref:THO complex subunit 1 n=4 Tax=Rhodosorus marinus TaxID=101924 RepID=A0A7S3EIX7_9RHOD|mmetsp:Transcript_36312/g.145226  ORF Transcript_36312/g.145226 Transcript_36312/m.145226 type:complete len:419 (+) Transcript_36312:1583-2839(+)
MLDAAIDLASRNLTDPETPFNMFQDAITSLSFPEVSRLFAMIEARAKRISRLSNFQGSAKFDVLRTLVEFLRRCSRVSDTAVCGRALTLLATMFPLSEKSAVNLRGHYNLSNITTFADHEDASGSAVADFKLYTKFWGLQKYLSRAYDVEDYAVWEKVYESMQQIMEAFEGTPVASTREADGNEEKRAVKFLTDPQLFRLQLGDGFFRRHILVQFLILLRHLRIVQKPEEAFDSSKSHTESAVNRRVLSLLDSIGPSGKTFGTGMTRAFYWEKHWIAWKANGCKPFDRAPVPFEASEQRRKRKPIGSDVGKPKKASKILSSHEDDDNGKPWALPSEEERKEDLKSWQNSAPTVELIQSQLTDDKDEEDPSLKRKNMKPYVWKTLRVLQRKNFLLVRRIAEERFDLDAILTAGKSENEN